MENTNEINNTSLKGRYLKALKDNPVSITMKAGEFLIITEDSGYSGKVVNNLNSPTFSTGYTTSYQNCWELMPVEFIPMIVNNYYKVTDDKFWMIGKVITVYNSDNGISNTRGNAAFIDSNNFFNLNKSWCYKSKGRTYQKATNEEIAWLDECIKQNKYVDLKEVTTKTIYKDSKGRLLQDFKVGEWWLNPYYDYVLDNHTPAKYFRIGSVEIFGNTDDYYTRLKFDQIADKYFTIFSVNKRQSNNDYEAQMTKVDFEKLKTEYEKSLKQPAPSIIPVNKNSIVINGYTFYHGDYITGTYNGTYSNDKDLVFFAQIGIGGDGCYFYSNILGKKPDLTNTNKEFPYEYCYYYNSSKAKFSNLEPISLSTTTLDKNVIIDEKSAYKTNTGSSSTSIGHKSSSSYSYSIVSFDFSLTPDESFKTKTNSNLLSNKVNNIQSITTNLKQTNKSKLIF